MDYARKDHDQIVVRLREVSVDPVQQVERPVTAQSEQVMAGDALRLAGLGDEEQLRKDGHRLQVDGERPEHLHDGEVVVDEQRENGAGNQQELNPEGVVVVIVRGPELEVN